MFKVVDMTLNTEPKHHIWSLETNAMNKKLKEGDSDGIRTALKRSELTSPHATSIQTNPLLS